jgi:hypothetical protein
VSHSGDQPVTPYRIASDGTVLWSANMLAHLIAPDGAGGLFALKSATPSWDGSASMWLYYRTSTGPSGPLYGMQIYDADTSSYVTDRALVSDESGGAYVIASFNGPVLGWHYADGGPVPGWPVTGLDIPLGGASWVDLLTAAPDGVGGVLVGMRSIDDPSSSTSMRVTRVLPSGGVW